MKKHLHGKVTFFMRVTVLQIVLLASLVSLANAERANGQDVLEKKITLRLKNTSFREVLGRIERLADVRFLYYSQVIKADERITLTADEERLASVLDKIFESRDIQYEADGNQIILTKSASIEDGSSGSLGAIAAPTAATVVSGVVRDESNSPLPGVNVLVRGTTNGTSTDSEGRYSLEVPDNDAVLVFSFIGYVTREIRVDNVTTIDVTMEADIATLSEIVVVGYGSMNKTLTTSSISSVQLKDLPPLSTSNMEPMLQGKISGVSVQSQSGAPGAPVRILIRGTSSINLSTDPLFIIDGMPIASSSGGLGSSNQSPMTLINPNDIERIEVLKDAAATAIYGSRGSNGVILITTKTGKRGEGDVQLNYSTGISSLTRTPEDVGFASTSEWFQIMDKAYQNSSGGDESFTMGEFYTKVPLANIPGASPKLTREQAQAINTNWYDELFQRGTFQNVNLSASQGTDNTKFFISSNYRNEKGVEAHTSLERFSIRSNLDFTPMKDLTLSTKLTFGYTKNDQRNSAITSISVNALPWMPVYELDNPRRYYNAYTGANAVASRDPRNVLNRTEQYRGLGGVSLEYDVPFLDGLSVKTELSGDIIQSNRVNWESRDIRWNSAAQKGESAASEEAVTFTGLNYNAYTTYNSKLEKHTINVVAGVEATRSYEYFRGLNGQNLTGQYQEIGLPTGQITVTGRKQFERYLLGYFGRANYGYKDRYLLGVSFRRDGSSVFREQNRWGTFVSVSGGWILSDEFFMDFLGDGTFLKLRGSYGEIGNQSIPPYLDVVNYNTNPVIYGGTDVQGVNGTIPVNIAVTDLQWETSRSTDIGLDFSMFRDRLSGSVVYYHRYVDNMLLQAALPASAGVSASTDLFLGQGSYDRLSTIWGNFGDMLNTGFEVELNTVNYEKNGFRWSTSFNIGLNRNEIRRLTPEIDNSGRGFENGFRNAISRTGDRRFVWYIADYAGVDPVTGVPMIYARDPDVYDANGSTVRLVENGEDALLPATITNIRNNAFYQTGKSMDPKYQGGITNNFKYKNFDFSFMVAFSGGNYILDYDRQQATIVNPTRPILAEVLTKSWQGPGDTEAEYPQLRARFTYRYQGADLAGFSGSEAYHNGFLYKGDFVRLRSVQLGYTVPADALSKARLKGAHIYVTGSNLFTFTDYPGFDPESAAAGGTPGFVYYSNSIPQLRTFTVGVDFKF